MRAKASTFWLRVRPNLQRRRYRWRNLIFYWFFIKLKSAGFFS